MSYKFYTNKEPSPNYRLFYLKRLVFKQCLIYVVKDPSNNVFKLEKSYFIKQFRLENTKYFIKQFRLENTKIFH